MIDEKFLWISNILPISIVNELHLSVAGKKMENAIVKFLSERRDCDVLSISDQGLDESKKNGYKLLENVAYKQICKKNIIFFGNLGKEKRIYNYLRNWCIKNRYKKKTVVIANYPLCACRPLIKLKKQYHLKLISIVQDYYQIPHLKGLKNTFLYHFNKKYLQKGFRMLNKFDGIIGLNDSIRKWIKPNVPFFRMMIGVSDAQFFLKPSRMGSPIKIGFFGSFVQQNGIAELFDAFNLLPRGEFEIHFYGSGPLAEDVNIYCSQNEYAHYHGFVTSDEVETCISSIDILINLQVNDDNIVSDFNFPSKMIDYYCSGRPVICTNFKGFPEQYKEFTFVVDNSFPETVKMKILELSHMRFEQVYEICKKAQDYIKKEQNYSEIVNKMLLFIDSIST